MKKLGYVLLGLLACGLGLGVGVLALHFTHPEIPSFTAITNIFSDAWNFVQTQIKNFTWDAKSVLAAISAFATPLVLAIKGLLSKLKKNQEVASGLIQDLRGDLVQENALKNHFQAEKQMLEQQVSELKTALETQTGEKDAKIAEMDKELIALRAQKNEALTILNAVKNPTVEDLKRKLEQQGFTVTQKVP